MASLPGLGKFLIVTGLALIIAGLLVLNHAKLPFLKYFGRLPGDFAYKSDHVQVYFPWVTCLLISIVLSVIMWVISKR